MLGIYQVTNNEFPSKGFREYPSLVLFLGMRIRKYMRITPHGACIAFIPVYAGG